MYVIGGTGSEEYMADATSVLRAYMGAAGMLEGTDRGWRWGQMAVALEIVTLIRTLESIPVVSVAEREGTIATLATLLREQDLEGAYEVYDMLAEWRRVKFVRDNAPRGVSHRVRERTAPSQRDTVGVDDRSHARRPGRVSGDASLPPGRARQDRLDERGQERPSQAPNASSTAGQMELPFGEA